MQPRTRGHARLVAKMDGPRTVVSELRQQGSLKLVFPTLFRTDLEGVLVNTSGGVTGGDVLDVDVTAGAGTALSVTTQAAERLYRAQPGERGQISNRLRVEAGARLNWLPQETILFDHSAVQRKLIVEVAREARFLMVETLVMGRTAMGEILRSVDFGDRVQIYRGGSPLYLDGVDLKGDVAAQMSRPALGAGLNAMCSVVLVAPDAGRHVAAVRSILTSSGGASMIADDVMVLRLTATDSFELRRTLVPVLALLNETPLPKSWRL